MDDFLETAPEGAQFPWPRRLNAPPVWPKGQIIWKLGAGVNSQPPARLADETGWFLSGADCLDSDGEDSTRSSLVLHSVRMHDCFRADSHLAGIVRRLQP